MVWMPRWIAGLLFLLSGSTLWVCLTEVVPAYRELLPLRGWLISGNPDPSYYARKNLGTDRFRILAEIVKDDSDTATVRTSKGLRHMVYLKDYNGSQISAVLVYDPRRMFFLAPILKQYVEAETHNYEDRKQIEVQSLANEQDVYRIQARVSDQLDLPVASQLAAFEVPSQIYRNPFTGRNVFRNSLIVELSLVVLLHVLLLGFIVTCLISLFVREGRRTSRKADLPKEKEVGGRCSIPNGEHSIEKQRLLKRALQEKWGRKIT